nr:MAG: rhodanese-like domain-containing protein [Hyphomicrobiales bacterium]
MPDESEGILHELNPKELNNLLSDGKAIVIDVREATEYGAERIPGALLFPLSTFDPTRLPLDTKKQVVFHCGGGGRSKRAATSLFAHGLKEASHLAGGIRGWKAAGLPVIALDPQTGKPIEVRSA